MDEEWENSHKYVYHSFSQVFKILFTLKGTSWK